MKRPNLKQAEQIGKTLLVSGVGITIGAIIVRTTPNPMGVAVGAAILIAGLYGIGYAIHLWRLPETKKRVRVVAKRIARPAITATQPDVMTLITEYGVANRAWYTNQHNKAKCDRANRLQKRIERLDLTDMETVAFERETSTTTPLTPHM